MIQRIQVAIVVLLVAGTSAGQMPFPFPGMPRWRGAPKQDQQPVPISRPVPAATRVVLKGTPSPPRRGTMMSNEDGLTVISTTLQRRKRRGRRPDCSHLVNDIYKRAGFDYEYARSSDLYLGVSEFKRVGKPQAGDLVVWPGHVGIVVSPKEKSFYSSLRTGLGMTQYDAPAWKKRGKPRFYRYVKVDVPVLMPGEDKVAATEPGRPALPPNERPTRRANADLTGQGGRATMPSPTQSAKGSAKARVTPSSKTVFPPAVVEHPQGTTSDGPEE